MENIDEKTVLLNFPDNTSKTYHNLNYRYNQAKSLFEKFKSMEKLNVDFNTLFDLLKEIVNLVETNSVYNYLFLKYHKNVLSYFVINQETKEKEEYTYEYNLEELKETLKSSNYFELTKKSPINPAKEIYELMELYLNKENNKTKQKSKKKVNKDGYKNKPKEGIKEMIINIDINPQNKPNNKIKEETYANTNNNEKSDFDKKSKAIKEHKYNTPLKDAIERVRVSYYKSIFKEGISFEEEEKFILLCKGISIFKNIIKNTNFKNWIESIDLDNEEFNKELFVFISYLQMIGDFPVKKRNYVLNIYEKKFIPQNEIKFIEQKLSNNTKNSSYKYGEILICDDKKDEEEEEKEKNNKIGEEEELNYKIEGEENLNIEMIEDKINDNEEEEEFNEINNIKIINDDLFKIYNNFESYTAKRKDYVLKNLIDEMENYPDYPLRFLLERNQSFDYFFKNNKNIINNEKIYPKFIDYLKFFIKSGIVREALNLSEDHDNLINLLESDFYIEEIINEKCIISLPFYNGYIEGYTNKIFMISGISGFPFLISEYRNIHNKKEYINLLNATIIFNIGIKLIICLHEILIHLSYGYLFQITDGKISHQSPKSRKSYIGSNNPYMDGGSYFEELLFGEKVRIIDLYFVLRLLNGNFTTLKEFRKELKEPIDIKNPEKLGNFLSGILHEYPIDFDYIEKKLIPTSKLRVNGDMLCFNRI